MTPSYVYFGSFSFHDAPHGLHSYLYDAASGTLRTVGVYGEQPSLSMLCLKDGFLFAVSEQRGKGAVVSFRLLENGSLKECCVLNTQSGPLCYISADPCGNYIYTSSMGNSEVSMNRYDGHGQLTVCDRKMMMGHSIQPRQRFSRVHSVLCGPKGRFVSVCNLGADELLVLKPCRESGTLELYQTLLLDPGQGPRHFAYAPDGSAGYLLTELGCRIYAYRITNEGWREIAAYPSASGGEIRSMTPDSQAADILISRDGKSLYASNRGEDTIAVFSVERDGYLRLLEHVPCGGKGPRGIQLSPDEGALFCANTDSDTVTVLRRDPASGLLKETVGEISLRGVSCVRFVYR